MSKTTDTPQHILRLETVRYVISGGTTTLISFALFELLFRMGLNAAASNTISTVTAVLFAFITNKLWVFACNEMTPRIVSRQLIIFSAGRMFTFLLETSALYVLVDKLLFNQTVCKLVTTVIVIVLNYIISKLLVFTKSKPY